MALLGVPIVGFPQGSIVLLSRMGLKDDVLDRPSESHISLLDGMTITLMYSPKKSKTIPSELNEKSDTCIFQYVR